MRKIEFRGKSVKTGEWVYGYLIEGEADEKLYIGKNNMQLTEVDPETVGQFIGLYDMDNKPIYEGDVIVDRYKKYFTIIFDESSFLASGGGQCFYTDMLDSKNFKIIGDKTQKLKQYKKL